MITGVTQVTEFGTKSDMSKWTRAHADTTVISWEVFPGDGGKMIVAELEEARKVPDRGIPGPPVTTPPSPVREWAVAFA